MNLKIGDIVSRNSHNNDIYFKVMEIKGNVAILKGVDLRLYADSLLDDLKIETLNDNIEEADQAIIEKNRNYLSLDRSEYFYLPGKILHIDGDNLLSNCEETIIK